MEKITIKGKIELNGKLVDNNVLLRNYGDTVVFEAVPTLSDKDGNIHGQNWFSLRLGALKKDISDSYNLSDEYGIKIPIEMSCYVGSNVNIEFTEDNFIVSATRPTGTDYKGKPFFIKFTVNKNQLPKILRSFGDD